MKKFETPVVETIKFAVEDVITASSQEPGLELAQEAGVCLPEL